ncbi:MAG: histidine phosphatase family protein [Actinomycetota bacterium]
MELIFVRHGQPAWSVDGLTQPDPDLTQLGREQAELAARRIFEGDHRLTELVVSPARRSQQTAEPIARNCSLPIDTVDDIVEIKMPDWTGKLEETVKQIFRDAQHRPPEEWWDGLPGGESFRDFHDRVTSALLDVLAQRGVRPDPDREHLWLVDNPDQRIALVAHGGTNAVAIGFLLGTAPTPWEWERFILYHASFARLRMIPLGGEHVWSLRAFNDREHLPEGLRTR